MEMPAEPGTGVMSFMPSFVDAKPVKPAPDMSTMGDIMESFFGHLPEEPKPAPGTMGDFGVRALVAFDRVPVRKGESQKVTLHVAPCQLQFWSTNESKWVTASGKRTLSVGGSSRELPLHQEIE